MKHIQEMLRHSTITTTMDIYTDVDPELEVKAAMALHEMLFN
ncbi:integrase [Caldalkalibacillus uzonensis]|uniref:Integrase n=1 Tax=Caldalkalibacillus uzonensis TaxID=353224 RepID=A0ABU0CXV1_9BACI|nr:integrase [Caldalkalibacillus uzonensis]